MSNTKLLTIAQLCPRLNSGGIERGTADVAIAVKKAGMRSIVISGGGHLHSEITEAGVEHLELPLYLKSPWSIQRNSKALQTIFANYNIDLVHARSRAPIWATHLALKDLDIPLVTSCHSPHGDGPMSLKKLYNRVITYGDRIIATSDYISNYLQQGYHVPASKIDVIYRGIDCEHFDPNTITEDQKTKMKHELGLDDDAIILLLPGRITRWKGQDVLVKAINQLKEQHNVYGIIVGRVDSSDFYNELKTLISAKKLEQRVKFIEESFDMPLLYAIADITLSTSRKAEAFGRVAVEGQAMKSLVIATNLGAAKETVLEGKTGFLVPPNNPDSLAQALSKAITLSNAQCDQITTAARQRVLSTFNKTIMLEKTLELYGATFTLNRDFRI